MAIFRLQDNVPDVYARKSRDFQLLCNTFDAVFNGVKNDIDGIVDAADTRLCSEQLLPLLQTKLGFFTRKHLTTSELRTVLQAFKYVVRDKGSRVGILAAIEVFLKVVKASSKSKVTLVNNFLSANGYIGKEGFGDTYIVEISIEQSLVDTTLLTELLRYVLPTGYQLKYSFYSSLQAITQIQHRDTVHIVFVNVSDNDGVKLTMSNDPAYKYRNVNGVSTTSIWTVKSTGFIIDWDTTAAPLTIVGDDTSAEIISHGTTKVLAVREKSIFNSFAQNQYVEISLDTMGATELAFGACSVGFPSRNAHYGVRIGDTIYWDCKDARGKIEPNDGKMKSYNIVGQTMVMLGDGEFGEASVVESKKFTVDDISKISALVIKPNAPFGSVTVYVGNIVAVAKDKAPFEDAKKATLPSNEPESEWLKDLEES